MRPVVIFALLIASSLAAPKRFKAHKSPPQGPRIIGGQEVEPHSIPYQAFVEGHSTTDGWYCSGTLISQNYVMTAGHCGRGAVEVYITLGAHRVFEDEDTQVKVISTEITVHENFSDVGHIVNDISVMKLSAPVEFTDAIQPAVLSTNPEDDYKNVIAAVSGWGLTETPDQNGTMSKVLNVLHVQVLSYNLCSIYFGNIPESVMCTFTGMDTYVCMGDSGGPLSLNGTQIGIVSFGDGGCNSGTPIGYTRINLFLDWLQEHTDVQINV